MTSFSAFLAKVHMPKEKKDAIRRAYNFMDERLGGMDAYIAPIEFLVDMMTDEKGTRTDPNAIIGAFIALRVDKFQELQSMFLDKRLSPEAVGTALEVMSALSGQRSSETLTAPAQQILVAVAIHVMEKTAQQFKDASLDQVLLGEMTVRNYLERCSQDHVNFIVPALDGTGEPRLNARFADALETITTMSVGGNPSPTPQGARTGKREPTPKN